MNFHAVLLIPYVLVILLHLYFVVLEMVLWKRLAPRVFRITQEYAKQSVAMASNQGLYNLFLVVALLIPFYVEDRNIAVSFQIYGLLCVIVAGIWGGITINKKIILVQSVPAIVALLPVIYIFSMS